MQPTRSTLTGDACGAALVAALKAWRTSYAPHIGYEGLVGGPIVNVKLTLNLSGPGEASVLVEVEARRAHECDQYWFAANFVAGQLRLESIAA